MSPDSVWLARADIQEITRLDRLTGEVLARLPVDAWGLSFGGGGLWWYREGSIGRIDPITEQVAFEPVLLSTDAYLNNIYIGDGDAWTSQASSGHVWRVGRSGKVSTFALAPGVGEMAATDTTMWVTNQNTGALTGIDLITGQIGREIDTGHATIAAAAGGDELMIAVGPTVREVIDGLEGSVLTATTFGLPWSEPAPDPPTNWSAPVRQMLNLTCVHLLNYPDEPGSDGLTLQPELATGPPTISADGRTYTFTIRPGFKFSPPSNEEVTAETIRQTLQRALDAAPRRRESGSSGFWRNSRRGRIPRRHGRPCRRTRSLGRQVDHHAQRASTRSARCACNQLRVSGSTQHTRSCAAVSSQIRR